MSRFSRYLRCRVSAGSERGAVAIIVALSLVVLLIIGALVLDLGDLYKHDRDLQSAADAGALAGAQQLILNMGLDSSLHAAPRDMAIGYVDNNVARSSVDGVDPWEPQVEPTAVTVDLRESGIPFWFANVMPGHESGGTVKAHARAEIKYVTGVRGVAPFALLVMNPEKFRFVFRQGAGQFGQVEITDGDKDGWYGESGEGGGSVSPTAPGLYYVTLQAIGTVNGVETVGLELPDIGVWRAFNRSDPNEVLFEAGMEQDDGDGSIRVYFNVRNDAVSATATLGRTPVSNLIRTGDTFSGVVAAPTNPRTNEGYATYDLKVTVTTPKAGGSGTETSHPITCGRYIAFNGDVPLKYLMMTPLYQGYSGAAGAPTALSAKIFTQIPHTGDGKTYTLKLSNQAGAGIYAGNWRLADIYRGQNTATEIGTMDLATIDSWTLNYPLVVDGPLMPEPGDAAGQVASGLNDRVANSPDDTAWRHVIIPVVDFSPDLAGSSQNYTIRFFAEFYIVSNPPFRPNDELLGQFVSGPVNATDWTDEPTGPLYVQTAVLTE